MAAHDIVTEANQLRRMFDGRDRQITTAYKMLDQVDENAQEDMESFVSNEARTTWNMGTFLLQPRPLVHNVSRRDTLSLTEGQSLAARVVEAMLQRIWIERDRRMMRRGGSSWFWDFIGKLTATGWYAVPYGVMSDKFLIDAWQPITAYPEFSLDEEEGLIRLAKIWRAPIDQIIAFGNTSGWNMDIVSKTARTETVYQLWKQCDDNGKREVTLGVSVGDKEVRPEEVIPGLTEIPVLIGGVGGIPANFNNAEMMLIRTSDPTNIRPVAKDEMAVRGQSIMATNANVYANLNKQWTFIQQLLHDTANPKTWEKHEGTNKIIRPHEFFRRGAHFGMGVNESAGVFETPGIPAEATQLIFQLRNMFQRGGFSDITFGNITQEVTSVLMSQAVESARQLLTPFHNAITYVTTEVSRAWFRDLSAAPNSHKNLLSQREMDALTVLKESDDDFEIISDYTIQIPGDVANRLQMAKFASPSFELSVHDAYKLFVPEVPDVAQAIARAQTDKAQDHESIRTVIVIHALERSAAELQDANPKFANLYRQMAERLKAATLGQPQQPQLTGGPSPQGSGLGPSVIPGAQQEAFGGTADVAGANSRNGATGP